MAFLRFIDDDNHILGEMDIQEPNNEMEWEGKFNEYAKPYPKCTYILYWTDSDLKRGYNHPYTIPTKKKLQYLKENNLY